MLSFPCREVTHILSLRFLNEIIFPSVPESLYLNTVSCVAKLCWQ